MAYKNLFLTLFLSFFILAAASAAELKVGFMAELSGSNANNGVGCREGVETARKWLGETGRLKGMSLEVFYEDHRGDTKAGLNAFQSLTQMRGVRAVIATRSQVVIAANPLSRAAKVPLLATVGHKDFVRNNPYSWRFYLSAQAEGNALAKKAIEMGFRRLSTISLEDEFTLSLKDEIEKKFLEMGGSVVQSPTVSLQDMDLVPVAGKVKAADPDIIFINATIAQSGLLIRKLREIGVKAQMLGNIWAADKDTIESAGLENIEGLIIVSVDFDKPKFASTFNRTFPGASLKAVAYMCNAALAAVVQAASLSPDIQKGLENISTLRLEDEELRIVNREVQFNRAYRQIIKGQVVAAK